MLVARQRANRFPGDSSPWSAPVRKSELEGWTLTQQLKFSLRFKFRRDLSMTVFSFEFVFEGTLVSSQGTVRKWRVSASPKPVTLQGGR